MNIQEEYFIFINIGIILIYVVFALSAYRNGLLSQLLSLVYNILSIVVAWYLAPILASRITLVKIDSVYNSSGISSMANSILFMAIIFIVLRILYLIIKPLFKSISKIPIIGGLNKIGGFIFGIINATLVIVVLTLIMNLGFIKNFNEVKENTLLKYTDKLSQTVMKVSIDNLNLNSLKKYIDDFDVDESRETFTKWLIDQGILNE